MNKRTVKQCKRIGCTELTRNKLGYCEEHIHIAKEKETRRNKYYDNNVRDKKYTDFYNSGEWDRARIDTLSNYNGIDLYAYYINKEIELANTIHHIIELKEDWDKRLDEDNLFPTSESNHNKIHNLYKKDKNGTQRLLRELMNRYRAEFGLSPLPSNV